MHNIQILGKCVCAEFFSLCRGATTYTISTSEDVTGDTARRSWL